MILFKIFQNSLFISIFVMCLSCSGSKKKDANGDNQNTNQLEEIQNLPPLTCDSMFIDKTKNIVYFRFNNNTDVFIGLLDYPTFEYKNNSEWKKIHFKGEFTGIMLPGEPIVPIGGDYICKLFLNEYVMDSVSNFFRIVQPYHIKTYDDTKKEIDRKYLYHEFTIPE